MSGPRTTVMTLVVATCWFSLYAYLPILPAYAKELGASYEMVGMIVGGYGFTQMILRLPQGILSDKLCKRKVFVVAGLATCAISGAAMFAIPSVTSLLIFRALAGVAATTWVIQTVLYVSYFEPAQSPRAVGRVNALGTGGQMLATLTGGIIAFHFGETYTFLLAAIAGVIGLVLSLFVTENCAEQHRPITLPDILQIGRERSLVSASLLALLVQLVTYGTAYGFMPIAAKNIGANSFEMGLLPTLFMIPGIFASMISGSFFAARFGVTRSIMLGFAIMSVPVLFISGITDIKALYLTQIISGFGRGITFPLLMQCSISNIASHQKATAMGYYQSIYGLGMVVGPIIVGILGGRLGLDWGFGAIGLIGLVGMAAAAVMLPDARVSRQQMTRDEKTISSGETDC